MTVSRIARRIAAPAARTTSATPVAVRLSRAELDRFDAAWRRIDGLSSRAEAMRRLVRQAAGMLDADPATLAEWRDIARQLRGAAVNLNQMARAANAGLPGWGPREEGELRRLARIAGTLARNYAGMVAVAGRKSRAADLLESGAPWP